MSWRAMRLFGAYFGGNTRVRTTLGSAGPACPSMTFVAFRRRSLMECSSAVSAVEHVDGDRGSGRLYCWLASRRTRRT